MTDMHCRRCDVQWTHPTPDRYSAPNCWLCGLPGEPVQKSPLPGSEKPS